MAALMGLLSHHFKGYIKKKKKTAQVSLWMNPNALSFLGF